MKSPCLIGLVTLIGLLVLAPAVADSQAVVPAGPTGRFAWVDVTLTSTQLLAAWQFELSSTAGRFEIVGVEGGEHAAFAEPPYYDPAALRQGRIILAAFSTDEELPVGATRVARVHVYIPGAPPVYSAELIVAATADGSPIDSEISLVEGAAE